MSKCEVCGEDPCRLTESRAEWEVEMSALREANASMQKDIHAVQVWLCDWDEDTDSIEELVKKVCGLMKHRLDDNMMLRVENNELREVLREWADIAANWVLSDEHHEQRVELLAKTAALSGGTRGG